MVHSDEKANLQCQYPIPGFVVRETEENSKRFFAAKKQDFLAWYFHIYWIVTVVETIRVQRLIRIRLIFYRDEGLVAGS